ncbi:non-specific lipid transfer protein GPI-anchored 11-like [Euphorbia lathyris]|uniref:non-specific lipid transfer protein GPI-anchored 11-like n=1 Tax=Euphorbia lathyris TaxID=212925 RepID=UPI00331349B7
MVIEAEKNEETPTPAAALVDCSTVIYDMLDCIPYLSEGSHIGKVDSSCCYGLESVVSVDNSCLCFGFKESVALGIRLNFTRAFHLPSDCNMTAPPSLAHCSVSSSSSPSPTPSPSSPPPHSHLSPKSSPSPKAPSSSKPPVSAPKSSSSSSPSPASSASPEKPPIIISETSPAPAPVIISETTPVAAPAPTKAGASSISIISIINLVLIIISMMIV